MSTEAFAIDGSYVHTIDGVPLREISEDDLKRWAVHFASQTTPLIEAHKNSLSQLVANEQNLALVTHELSSRRRILTS